MIINEKVRNEFPLFDDFREVLRVLDIPNDREITISLEDGTTVKFEPREWNWLLKAAEKGWKLL